MKLLQNVTMDSPFPLTSSPDPSGTSMSSKTPGKTWRTGGVMTQFLIMDLDETFTECYNG